MYTETLQSVFDGLIRDYKLDLRVNEALPKDQTVWALDVEHDEQGGFVGVGFYSGGVSY